MMRGDRYRRRGLNDQADRIEKVLSSLDMPAKIHGGKVGEDRIRYYLTPKRAGSLRWMRQMARRVAQEIGVHHLRITEAEGGVVLDLPKDDGGPRLLPLLASLETPPPLTSFFGIDKSGGPYSINFRSVNSRNLFILGGAGMGKSEFLRSILISIAMYNRQTQVNFLAIDISGNELSTIEALPHRLVEMATDIRYGLEVIEWLMDEIERREVFRIRYPELVLVMDDFDKLVVENPRYLSLVGRLMKEGKDTGIHIVAASSEFLPLMRSTARTEFGMAFAQAVEADHPESSGFPSPGMFQMGIDTDECIVRVAWMPVMDLQEAVSLIHSGKNHRGLKKGLVRWY